MVVAEFKEEIRTTTPIIVESLKDPEWGVRGAAIIGLSSLVVHCMYYH